MPITKFQFMWYRVLASVTILLLFLGYINVSAELTDTNPSASSPRVESDAAVKDSVQDVTEPQAYLTPFRMVILGVIAVLIFIALITLVTKDGRRSLRRAYYLTITLVSIEVGTGGFLRLLILSVLPSIGVAYAKGYKSGEKLFDWHTFWFVLVGITVVTVFYNLLQNSMHFKRTLSPGAGHVWRDQRKTTTAAIIKRINLSLGKGSPLKTEEVRRILSDLLDIVVLHVRDHRGSFNEDKQDVFANILLDAGDKLVVIARDSNCNKPGYTRATPFEYGKAGLICARAMEVKKPLSVGDLVNEYPEGPKNKPYKSILAIPLIASDDSGVYGALSLDSSRLYFFETFLEGQAENQLENTLQPYIQLVTLILETLVHRNSKNVLESLRRVSAEEHLKDGGTNG
jgi:hypothetical protein